MLLLLLVLFRQVGNRLTTSLYLCVRTLVVLGSDAWSKTRLSDVARMCVCECVCVCVCVSVCVRVCV